MVKRFDLPRASAADVARSILEGVERGEEEIFPDPMSQQMAALWRRDPKELERTFASL